MNDELLISLVEQAPHLYNRSLKEYKNELIKENSWKSIASYLNSTPEIVKKRWENLRDKFVRCYREFSEKPPSGSGALNKKIDFAYFETMMWLAPFIKKRKLTSSAKLPSPVTESQESASTPERNISHVSEEGHMFDISSDEVLSPPPLTKTGTLQAQPDSPRSRSPSLQSHPESTDPQPGSSQLGVMPQPKRRQLYDTMSHALESFNKLCEARQHKPQSSSDMNFMSSVIDDMQLLSSKKKITFKRDIMELLIKYLEDDD